MNSVRLALSVQNDARVLVNFKSTDRPAWIGDGAGNPKSIRHWISDHPFDDTGAGAYGFVPHLAIDGTCFGAVALTRNGAVASLDRDDPPPATKATAPGSTAPVTSVQDRTRATPVGSRARGLVDCGVTFARPLRDGTAVLAGRRMQHIRLHDDMTRTVCPFFNFVTPVTALASRLDGSTVAGTAGGGVLLWAHGEETLSAALPEPFPGASKPADDDLALDLLQTTVRIGGVRGIAPLKNGRICVGSRDALLMWDPKDARLYTEKCTGIVNVACALGGSNVAILDRDGAVKVWDSRMGASVIDSAGPYDGMASDEIGNLFAWGTDGGYRLGSDELWMQLCTDPCLGISASPDGRYAAAKTRTNRVLLYDIKNNREVGNFGDVS